MAWTHEKIEETLKSVVEKTQADAVFREKLKNNPKETVATEAGETIPDTLRIAIVDQNDADIVITLPKVQSDELSDADLDTVVGAKLITFTYNCSRPESVNSVLHMYFACQTVEYTAVPEASKVVVYHK